MTLTQPVCLKALQKEFVVRYPEYHIQHWPSEIIIKPKHGFGGWVTIFFGQDDPIRNPFRMHMDGYWVHCTYHQFSQFRTWYKTSYLQHKMYHGYKGASLKCSEESNLIIGMRTRRKKKLRRRPSTLFPKKSGSSCGASGRHLLRQ